ncbi:MAG: glycosyltransferase family 2 protein, partial [Clostridiales bacterium]|nr:glycosyltransferase family 2 protein [Clostridiales bacterium]
MRLSIAMIVKNEESNIERSLKAIRKLDNKIEYEIVIVDTGSTDRTIEIAKKYTDKVYCHKWNGSFGDMRNISIKYCKGDWILVLDADEVIEDEEEIVKFLNSEDSKKYNAAEINFKNLLSEDTSNYLVATLFRLFKNIKEFYYVGKIHEQPRVVEPYTISKITVFHYGYSREDYELMKYKYERNKKLLLEDIKNGVEPIYSRFQLAQTYSMANMHREALETIKEAYKLDQIRKDGLHNINVYHFYSRELLSRCNYEMASKVANEGIDYCDSSLDLYYVVAVSNSYMNNISEANKGYDKYFEIRDAKEKGTFKAKTLGGTSLADYSYCRLEEMLNNYIRFNYNNKMYLNVIDKIEDYEETLESDENKLLYYCSLIKTSKVDQFIKCINNKNKDSDIQLIINVLEKIDSEEANINIKDIIKKILGRDHKLDSVLNLIYFKKKNNIDDINYEEYYGWKSIVFNEQLQNDSKEIDKLKNCSGVIQNYYFTNAINNYECLSILYNYSEENLLKTNLQELSFINNLDRTLICSPSIDKEKFNNLVIRIFINH